MASKRAQDKAKFEKEVDDELQALMDEFNYEEEDMNDEDRQLMALLEEEDDEEPEPKPAPPGKTKLDTFKQSFHQPVDIDEESSIPTQPPPAAAVPAKPPATAPAKQPETAPTKQPATAPAAQPTPSQPSAPTKQPDQPKSQPQKPKQQPTTPEKSPEKPAKKPAKPAPQKKQPPPPPPNYVNQPDVKNDEYDQLFSTFADTFYSLIHTKHNADKYMEQINKLLPVIVEGPSKPITGTFNLIEPKLTAPDNREYKEFKKDSICNALDPNDIDNVINEIKAEMVKVAADFKILNDKQLKSRAATVYKVFTMLKSSITLLKEEPYYIVNNFHYQMPIFNDSVPANTIRIEILEGKNFPKNSYTPAALVPMLQGTKNVAFPQVQGPTFKLNKAIDVKNEEMYSPAFMKKLLDKNEMGRNNLAIGIYEKGTSNKDIVSVFLTPLIPLIKCHEMRKTAIFPELGNATLDFKVSVNTSLGFFETNLVDRKIKVHPFCLFEMKQTNQAAPKQPAKPLPAKKPTPGGQPAVKPAQGAQLRPKETIAQSRPVAFPYIFTPEELQMFWPAKVLLFYTDFITKSKAECQKRKCPVADEINGFEKALKDKYAKIESAINEGEWTPKQYAQMIELAIKREQERLPTLQPDVVDAHKGNLNIMMKELKEMKEI